MCICISCFGRSGVYCMYQEIGTDASPAEMVTGPTASRGLHSLAASETQRCCVAAVQGSLMIRCLASAVQKARSLPALFANRKRRDGDDKPGEVRV